MKKGRGTGISKRGLSPIIATVLLIAVSLALAVIIFIWARGFIAESISKNGASIEDECKNVKFLPEIHGENLVVENLEEVPIYSFEIKEKTGGDIAIIDEETEKGVAGGSSDVVKENYIPSEAAEELIITPILLGANDASRKKWLCDEEFAEKIPI